jgi:hypothetical protein
MQQPKQLFTSHEAAYYLAAPENSLRLSRTQGERGGLLLGVPAPNFLKIGRSVRYKKEDLDNWLEQFAQEEVK